MSVPKKGDERSELGLLIEQGLREALAFERGELEDVRVTERVVTAREAEVRPPPRFSPEDVKRIRERVGFSQSVFAEALNASRSTVQSWEQGKREPDGPSCRLLQMAAQRPGYFRSLVTTGETRRERRGGEGRSRGS